MGCRNLTLLCVLSLTVPCVAPACGQSLTEPFAEIPLDTSFPDGISPSHVFAKAELLNRCLEHLIEVWNEQQLGKEIVRVEDSDLPFEVETQLRPMHVYQAMLICTWRLQQLDDHKALQVRHIPTLSSQPRVYAPRDAFFLVTMMLENVHQIGQKLRVQDLPADEIAVTEMTPTDVFYQGVRVFMKLNALNDREELKPSEVFSQMVRAGEDARTVLRQTDPASRYRIDRPDNTETRQPVHVFGKCLEIRELINRHAEALGIEVTPLPEQPTGLVRPRDVFFQTQIIIAELNLMKLHLGTVSSTPLAIEVSDDTAATDVYQQAMLVEYLVRQIQSGAGIPLADKK